MRYVQRQRLLNAAHARGEAAIQRTVEPLLRRRFKWLNQDLRRANLRKRLYKNLRAGGALFKQDEDWQDWIDMFTQALEDALPPVIADIADVETKFWLSRQARPDPVDPADVLAQYAARVGRQIKNIAVTTRDQTLSTITDWYNTDAGLPELIASLQQWYSPSRAETIGRTESTYLTSSVSYGLYQQMDVGYFNVDLADEDGEWPCDICRDMAAANPHSMGDEMPAYHPRCRCGTVPANSDGGELIYGGGGGGDVTADAPSGPQFELSPERAPRPQLESVPFDPDIPSRQPELPLGGGDDEPTEGPQTNGTWRTG